MTVLSPDALSTTDLVYSIPLITLSPAPSSPLVVHFPGHLRSLSVTGRLLECTRKALVMRQET